MNGLPQISIENLKDAVARGQLQRSDLLDEMPDGLILIDEMPEADSLDRVELAMAIEQKYSVSLITVGDLLDFIEFGDAGGAGVGVLK
jgi:acyl carrier protein